MRDKIRKFVAGLDKGFYGAMFKERNASNALSAVAIAMEETLADNPPALEMLSRRTAWFAKRFNLARYGATGEAYDPAFAAEQMPSLAQYARDTWYLEKSYEAYGLALNGERACRLKDFFGTDGNLPALFPAWLDAQVMAGKLAVSLVPRLTIGTQVVDSNTYRGTELTPLADNLKATVVPEGAEIPALDISTSPHSLELKKIGLGVRFSYEANRQARADVVGLFIAKAFQRLGIDETNLLLTALRSGDGNDNAATVVTGNASGTLTWEDYIKLGVSFGDGYNGDTGVMGANMIESTMGLAEFRCAQSATIQVIANVPNPLKVNWLKWTDSESPLQTDETLQIDPRVAAMKVQESGLVQDRDQIIDRQINRIYASEIIAFKVLDGAGTKILDVTY